MNNLKTWRLERGLSQIALASISHVPKHFIQLAEAGIQQPSTKYMFALAKALGVELKDLFPCENVEPTKTVRRG